MKSDDIDRIIEGMSTDKNSLRKAAEMALEGLETLWDILDDIDTASDMAKENDAWYRKRVEALQRKRWDTMITTDGYKLKGGPVEALRQALDDRPPVKTYAGGKPNYCTPEIPCKTHPDAPHGFDRNASHSADRYVCECEGWEPVDGVYMTPDRVDETAKGEHIIDCTDEQLIEEVRRRGFVIRDAQIGRKWVGLTDDERSYYLQAAANVGWWQAALFVERALKEKNAS